MQIGDMAMDFSNDVVAGLGLDTDDKIAVREQIRTFTKNLYSLKVCPRASRCISMPCRSDNRCICMHMQKAFLQGVEHGAAA